MRGTGNRVKKKSKPPDQAKQSQRFVETARQLEIDERGKAFERALEVLLPPTIPDATVEPEPKKRASRSTR